jgi:tetratricopeptide (TPR) repeat protein
LEQFVAGAAVLAVLLFVFGIYGPSDESSYAEKLAGKRSQQQEQMDNAAEQQARKSREVSSHKVSNVPTTPPNKSLVQAKGKPNRIPTVERIEGTPQVETNDQVQVPDKVEPEKSVTPQVQEPSVESQPKERDEEVIASKPQTEHPETEPDSSEVRPSVLVARQLNAQGFRLMKNGRYAEAIPVLAQAVRSYPAGPKDPTYAYALYNLGRSLRLVGRPDLAIPILEERLKFADQRHIVARELNMARAEAGGAEPVNRVEFE